MANHHRDSDHNLTESQPTQEKVPLADNTVKDQPKTLPQASPLNPTPQTGWKGVLVKVLSVILSRKALGICSLLITGCLLFLVALVFSVLFFGSSQLAVFIDSLNEFWATICFYIWTVLPNILFEHVFVLQGFNQSFISRVRDALIVYYNNLNFVFAFVVIGGLLGHIYSLRSEKRHSTVMGLKPLTNLLGLPWLILWGVTLGLLACGFVLSVEIAQVVLALAFVSLGFYVVCFYSSHSR